MGFLNNVDPINETRYTTIPAQPGWFVFEWEGAPPGFTLCKVLIVAWLVEAEFFPQTTHDRKTGKERVTRQQDFFTIAYPVTTGGVDYDDHGSVIVHDRRTGLPAA